MSYCRWSSDNWKSDIYAYADVSGGFTIHVAGNRRVGHIPELPDLRNVTNEEFTEAYQAQMAALDKTELVPIGLPFDSATFREADLEGAIFRMKELKRAGYHVPEWAIESMEAELNSKE